MGITAQQKAIPLGYKQTEVGIIPEDWECTTVGQLVHDGILEKPLDGNHGNIHPKSGDFVSFGIPFVMANNVQNGHVDLTNCAFIRKEQADSLQKGFSRPGDVLLTHKATIGHTAIVGEIPSEYIMLTPQVTYYRVADRTRLSNFYLRQFFESASFQSILMSMSGGGTRSYIGITAQLQLPVVLPPIKAEQEAIAEALSDADALVESLEQLIAKKRDLKQAAMQQLLTGKLRLPGLSGVWEKKRLGEMGVFRGGNGFPVKYQGREDGDYPFFKVSDMNNDGNATLMVNSNNWISEHVRKAIGATAFPANSIVFAKIGAAIFLERKKLLVQDSCIDNNMMAFIPVQNMAHYAFIHYLFLDMQLGKFVSTTALPSLNGNELAQLVRPFPLPAEQEAIAAVLAETDAELAALEQRHEKTCALKQGMMQELLTGKTRLI